MSRIQRPLLMSVRPLWLRARVFYKFYLRHAHKYPHLFVDTGLHFAPTIRMDLLPTDVSHGIIALAGFYELPLSRRIASLARAGGVMIDVGANYGYYTCLWAGAHPSNRVLALEASPRNIEPLKANIRKNQLGSRVILRHVAVGNTDSQVPFTLGPEEQTGWGGIAPSSNTSTVQISCTRLDHAVSELGWQVIDVLKIDVEGADTWVLYGAKDLLKARRIRHIFFEQHPGRMSILGIGSEEAATWLGGLGYRLERLTRTEWHAVPREG